MGLLILSSGNGQERAGGRPLTFQMILEGAWTSRVIWKVHGLFTDAKAGQLVGRSRQSRSTDWSAGKSLPVCLAHPACCPVFVSKNGCRKKMPQLQAPFSQAAHTGFVHILLHKKMCSQWMRGTASA